jgi:Fic family protein
MALIPIDVGEFKAGQKVRQDSSYKCFSPELIDREWIIKSPEINSLLSNANRKIGELNAFSQLIPDVDFFIKMHVAKEATTSSKIEGTQTSIEEAFLKEEDISPEKRDDWEEVQNYIEAMNHALNKLKDLPLSNRLLKDTHKILLQGVRGHHKMPGEFRSSQNWIGGATIRDAVFVPPSHIEVQNLMSDLERFLHNDEIHVPELIRIAIAHYQFETIHPFLDGNGRLGRLLITLYLVSAGILEKPTLYLSAFFEQNRDLYYDNLTRVRVNHDLKQWLKFFLVGVTETAQRSIETFRGVIRLKDDVEGQVVKLGTAKYPKAIKLVKHLYKNPIITYSDVQNTLEVSPPTANTFIKDFITLGILKEFTGFKRNRIYNFESYIKLFY